VTLNFISDRDRRRERRRSRSSVEEKVDGNQQKGNDNEPMDVEKKQPNDEQTSKGEGK
jgi:hypothetical protein